MTIARVVELVDQAGPPPDPAALVAQSQQGARQRAHKTSRAEGPRPSDASPGRPAAADPPASAAASAVGPSPPAAGALSVENSASSQSGGSAGENNERSGARRSRRSKAMGKGGADPLDMVLAFYPQTDFGNSERFVQRQGGKLLWCPAIGWLWWDGRRWCRDGADERVKRAEHETVRAIQNEATALAQSALDGIAKTVNAGSKKERDLMMSDLLSGWGRASEQKTKLRIADDAKPYLYVEPGALDADPFKITVGNGTLVIRRTSDGGDYVSFKPHDPGDRITKLAPIDYDPKAAAPIYDRFIGEVQPNVDNVRFLHAWGGYCLTGDASEQKLVFNWGKGKNGKSTLLDAWGHVAGDYGRTIPIETFVNEGRGRNAGQATPDLAMLHGVRFLRASEPERGTKLAEALIKLVTGGEEVPVRHLHRDYFMLRPVFKLTMSGNYQPKIEGADEGIWRRVQLVPWLVTVSDEKRDRGLPDKLRAEASGILNRMLDGLRDWLDRGLVAPEDVLKATAKYREDSDPLGRFLKDCTLPAPDHREQATTVHEVFAAWATANGATVWSPKGFANAMKERGYESKHSNVNWWLNVKLTKRPGDFVDSDGRALRVGGSDREPIPIAMPPPDPRGGGQYIDDDPGM